MNGVREIVVDSALQRRQVKQYLDALGVDWVEVLIDATVLSATVDGAPAFRVNKSSFRVAGATDEQWTRIQDWVKKVTG